MKTPSIGKKDGNNDKIERPIRSKFLQNILITYNSSPSPSPSPSSSACSISASDDDETSKDNKNDSINLSTSDGDNTQKKSKKKKRFRRSYNCGPCKKHKIKCDMKLPCGSCTKYGREDFCLLQPPNPPTKEQMLVKQERRRKYIQKRVKTNSLGVKRQSVVSSVSNLTLSPPPFSITERSVSLNNPSFNSQQQFFTVPNVYPQNYIPIQSNDHFQAHLQNEFTHFIHQPLNNININQSFLNPYSYPPNLPYNNDLIIQNQNGIPFITQQQQQYITHPLSPPSQQQFWLLNPNITRNSIDDSIPSNKNRFYYPQYPNSSHLPIYQTNSNGLTIPPFTSNYNYKPTTVLQKVNNIESESLRSLHSDPSVQSSKKRSNKNKNATH